LVGIIIKQKGQGVSWKWEIKWGECDEISDLHAKSFTLATDDFDPVQDSDTYLETVSEALAEAVAIQASQYEDNVVSFSSNNQTSQEIIVPNTEQIESPTDPPWLSWCSLEPEPCSYNGLLSKQNHNFCFVWSNYLPEQNRGPVDYFLIVVSTFSRQNCLQCNEPCF
jgi:hypothetical protein